MVTGASLAGFGETAQTQYVSDNYAKLGTTSAIITQAILAQRLPISVETARSRLGVQTVGLGIILVEADGPTIGEASGLAQGVMDALVREAKNQRNAIVQRDLARLKADRVRVNQQLVTLNPSSREAQLARLRYTALSEALAKRNVLPFNQVNAVTLAVSNGRPIAPMPFRDAQFAFVVALI